MNTWLVKFHYDNGERRTWINHDNLEGALEKWRGHYPGVPPEALNSITIEVRYEQKKAMVA